MKLFKYERSTTSLAPPSGFGTKNPLEHHSEGSLTGTSSINLFLTLFYMGSRKYLNTWGGTKFPPYIKVLKMLETWLHGMSDTSNESLEHV